MLLSAAFLCACRRGFRCCDDGYVAVSGGRGLSALAIALSAAGVDVFANNARSLKSVVKKFAVVCFLLYICRRWALGPYYLYNRDVCVGNGRTFSGFIYA